MGVAEVAVCVAALAPRCFEGVLLGGLVTLDLRRIDSCHGGPRTRVGHLAHCVKKSPPLTQSGETWGLADAQGHR